ncbi:hypothetical protein M8542_35385 [Amycolatopsis sp. OK19-0408]|uniref:Uncharacterized protein n=1 Tax=Amycolatopsis iheyensis TaxID=2945988 RepID=A0A9X2SMY3_9PSEU|nr:hypothetical protein [Amycolatopsis iheyensis]MCR6488124.1 hypothetical protein [Amycolatopsis iheyensis]
MWLGSITLGTGAGARLMDNSSLPRGGPRRLRLIALDTGGRARRQRPANNLRADGRARAAVSGRLGGAQRQLRLVDNSGLDRLGGRPRRQRLADSRRRRNRRLSRARPVRPTTLGRNRGTAGVSRFVGQAQ